MRLAEKIADICERYASLSKEKPLIDENGDLLVSALDRRNAKCRYLSYRCRRHVWSSGREDRGDLELSDADEAIIDQMAVNLFQGFPIIEGFYKQALIRQVQGRLDLSKVLEAIQNPQTREWIDRVYELGIANPVENRRLFIWDILWALIAIYPERDFTQEPDRGLFLENIERRLRKIERMRYNVSRVSPKFNRARKVWIRGLVEDGYVLRMFEYPSRIWDRPVSIGGKAGDEDLWEQEKEYNFCLTTNGGKQNPLRAIELIFEPKSPQDGWKKVTHRTHNLCDRVLHILHLDELVEHLKRNEEEDASEILESEANVNPKRISIVSSFTTPEAIGSGTETDRFFERVSARLDELVPGDHIIIRNHPTYHGVAPAPAIWGIENALVTRLLGINLPHDIEVQGHGLGPSDFGSLQGALVKTFKILLEQAQQKIDLVWNTDPKDPDPDRHSPPDLDDPMILKKALTIAFDLENPFGVPERTMLDQALHCHNIGQPFIYDRRYTYLNPWFREPEDPTILPHKRFDGVIEFRNEYASRGKGAFWVRWISSKTFDLSIGIVETPDPPQPPIKTCVTEFQFDKKHPPLSYNLPFVETLTVDHRTITMTGQNLTQVMSVYLVLNPRRLYSANFEKPYPRSYLTSYHLPTQLAANDPGAPLISSFGTEVNVDFTSEDQLRVEVPAGWNPEQYHWRPVLRTPVGIELRVQDSLFWGDPNSEGSIVQDEFKYHVAYFPLFEEITTGNFNKRVKIDATDNIGLVGTGIGIPTLQRFPGIYPTLQRFYREHQPAGRISTIRPRLEDL